jgi:hypothetical protein
MTLKNRIENIILNYQIAREESKVNMLVQIFDDHAIEFADWTHNLRNDCVKDSTEYNKWENISNKELLQIFKKEKGL